MSRSINLQFWKSGVQIKNSERFLKLIFTCIFVLLILPAHGQDLRLSGSNRAEYWFFVDPNLDTTNYKDHLTEKLKLSLDYKELTMRGIFFFWEPSLRTIGRLSYIDYSAQYKKDPVLLLYGRYYATFGRGLCLNQFLDEDFNNDNSLFGVKVDLSGFKSRVTLLSGKPRNIFFEELQYKIKNDTTDQIRGVNFETSILNFDNPWGFNTSLGGRYVRINRKKDMTPKAFTELFGGGINFKLGPWENYLEYAQRLGTIPRVGGRLKGDGYLFTSALSLTGFGLSLQYMDYNDLGVFSEDGYRYNEPPTPIKSGISVNRGVDEIGYGIAVVTSPFDFISLEIDNNKVSTHDPGLGRFKELFYLMDGMAGVLEQGVKAITHPTELSEITIGVDYLVKQKIELPVNKKTETKPYLDLQYDFGTFFIELGLEQTFTTSDTSKYNDRAASVSVGKPERFVLTLRVEKRNRVPGWLIEKLGKETFWPMLELSLDLTTRHNLRLRIGGEKGGLVCSGGVCRFEEPFRGIKAVLTSIF
ncbi:MAG: DUF6029 family protein [candidate division WOR-3 bacterium]|nr:DUF6029 family protein [candidate division WOR-3 bacterium]